MRFPYLKTPDLSDAEREILMGRLKNETDEMKERFALLIERTLSSLKKHEVSMGELKALLKQLNAPKKSKLSNKLKKITDISAKRLKCYIASGLFLITTFLELSSGNFALI